jgi:hypothetical protein
MKLQISAPLTVCAALLGAALAIGCHDKRPAEGPMEYSGRKVDNAAEKTKEGAKTGAEKTKEGVKEAGHETKCAAKNAKDGVKKEPRDPACD